MPEHLVFLDYAPALSDGGGALKSVLTDDGLHPNAKGYTVMAPLAQEAADAALRRPEDKPGSSVQGQHLLR